MDAREWHVGCYKAVWRLLRPGPGPLLVSDLSPYRKVPGRPPTATVSPVQRHAEGARHRQGNRHGLLWCLNEEIHKHSY